MTTRIRSLYNVLMANSPCPGRNKTGSTLISDATKTVVPPAFQGHNQFSKDAMSTDRLWHCALLLPALPAAV